MRTSLASLSLLVSVVAGCTESTPTPTEPRAAAASPSAGLARSATSVPLKGSCSLTFTAVPFPPPPILHQVDVGTCHLTHMGLTNFYGEQDINLIAGVQSGWRTLTAANGDKLYFTHVGQSGPVGPGLIGFRAQFTIVGGTGRFAGATGSGQGNGVATLATNSTSMTMDAWINY